MCANIEFDIFYIFFFSVFSLPTKGDGNFLPGPEGWEGERWGTPGWRAKRVEGGGGGGGQNFSAFFSSRRKLHSFNLSLGVGRAVLQRGGPEKMKNLYSCYGHFMGVSRNV